MNSNYEEYFKSTQKGNSIVVDVNLVRATANEAESLKRFLTNLSTENIKSVILNLSKCNFIDSTFLSAIVHYNKTMHNLKEGIKLVLTDPRQFSIFKITKIDSLFKIYSSVDQAIA